MLFRNRNTLTFAIIGACVVIGSACAREPTDPSRSDLSGIWQSYDVDLYISSIRMDLVQPSPGIVVGKWFALGRTDNACTPGVFCADSSLVTGRNEVAQVVLDLLGAGTFVGVLASRDSLDGIIRSAGKNFHVAFKRYRAP
ncbi:MAG TPA: hypothetical protein VIF83_05415 [Gemmatimonadaceae bacterium]